MRPTGAAPEIPSTPARALAPAEPPPFQGVPDIAFVGPSRDSTNGQWYWRVGLLGFPPDTVVEISGSDTYGNTRVAPLAMTTAEGSWNPFTAGFGVDFAYGGTCERAVPATVTARGAGFSVTETAPRPLECDGGTTLDGPWPRPVLPVPAPAPPTATAEPSRG
ncbi:hypothetical protein SAMN05660690_2777 [Geodermatophilus telluris]|uniref:Uncharacterized protein n=1 Tax=Geodermatophilus telluris TaxID=1190417 RepID=A0A1G6Q8W9_9ACTN|nr:hypothetical protein SAMN05660690_2777 [Geodermatophilus telluris]